MADLTPERLADLAALLAAATPGPWAAETWYGAEEGGWAARGPHHANECRSKECADDECGDDDSVQSAHAAADAALIVAAVNALPDLLAELTRMRTLLDDDEHEFDLLKADIDEHLPEYVIDDGTDDPANERERVEYAGQELKSLRGEVAHLRTRNEALERVAEAARHTQESSRLRDWELELSDALAALDGVDRD